MTAGILGSLVAGLSWPDWVRYLGLAPIVAGAAVAWPARRTRDARLGIGLALAGAGLLIVLAA
ncbi:hypothetical protein [Kutzneria chonburiensis]|uniref:Uncharacterized protein n=1 Tax=Kutzneria chonburiensis TaxID=1483604 RepID=A0ABV6MT94_9PSEU|nr:hypothetical protein [Kutzneria chonburiensis]